MRFPVAVAVAAASSVIFAASVAAAQDPAPPAAAAAVAAADPTCSVERVIGVSKDDADAIEALVCGEVRSQLPYGGQYRIRIVKIGGKIALTLIGHRSDGGRAEKQLVLSGLDEVPVATPRLVEALSDQKHVEETQTVTNIVGQEARVPKKKASEVHFWIGMVAAATPAGQGAGAHLALSAGSDRWSFVGDLRAAGGAFADPAAIALTVFSLGMLEPKPKNDFSHASLSGGIRHHFSSSDTAVFAGGGIGLDYLAVKRKQGEVGLAGYLELGIDLLRTNTVGGALAIRVDAPTFQTTSHDVDYSGSYSGSYAAPRGYTTTTYTPIFGGNVSLRF